MVKGTEKTLEELQHLQTLLAIEKAADYEFYKAKVLNKPLAERRAEGFAWSPLTVTKSGYTYGDRAFITVERTTQLDEPHQFKSGNVVNFFTLTPDAYKPERSGVIHYINKNSMRIILNSKDIPDWLNDGNLGVDLLFDERTYIEMERALKQVITAKGNRLAELRAILMGEKHPEYRQQTADNRQQIERLNASQNQAVNDIICSLDVAVIHGPPGTGKTTTLTYAVKELAKTETTILVTAPSNTAADLLTERLSDLGLSVVRIGNISRVDENIVRHTLEAQVAQHPESKNIKKVRIQAAELRRKSRSFKRTYDHEARNQRERLKEEAKQMSAWATQLEEQLTDQILTTADVITCTLVGAAHSSLDNRKFRTVVIDEAAQALTPASWIPILKAHKVIFAGDPFQLPPTVKSIEAQKKGFAITLMERCIGQYDYVNLLTTQYRMNELIMGFSNQQFYENALKADVSVANRSLTPHDLHASVLFIDTAGCGFEEQVHPENMSRFNPEEFYILREYLYQYLHFFDYEKPTIGILSPYREQVLLMKDEVGNDEILQNLPITVQTIDGFQGQERDMMLISLVRSNEKAEIGFLTDYRRMNVAMTRAKMKLVVIGDSSTIGENKFYSAFLDYCEKKGSYISAWEFMQPS